MKSQISPYPRDCTGWSGYRCTFWRRLSKNSPGWIPICSLRGLGSNISNPDVNYARRTVTKSGQSKKKWHPAQKPRKNMVDFKTVHARIPEKLPRFFPDRLLTSVYPINFYIALLNIPSSAETTYVPKLELQNRIILWVILINERWAKFREYPMASLASNCGSRSSRSTSTILLVRR